MPYHFKGNLRGFLCSDCYDYLSGVTVKFYRVARSEETTARAVLTEKETFHLVNDEELSTKRQLLIAEATTDEKGFFELSFSDDAYKGEAFDIDLELNSSIKPEVTSDSGKTYQVHVTTLQPAWRGSDREKYFGWEYAIPARFWCRILSMFDIWTICGHVHDCETKKPAPGVKVTAFDSDLFSDDTLGSALTDSAGHFKIVFPGYVFRQSTIPGLNIEFPSGPDLYFHVELPGTSPAVYLLKEPGNAANTIPGRKNVGHCTCVELCVDLKNPVEGYPIAPLFTHVGNFALGTGFDANGFGIPGTYAFTSHIPLQGDLPGGTNSNEVEFRFRVIDVNTAAEIPWSALKTILQPFTIGHLQRLNTALPPATPTYPYERINVTLNPNSPIDADANGWIKVPRQRDYSDGGAGVFIHDGLLGILDTSKLVQHFFDLTTPTVYGAGTAYPASRKFTGPDHTYRIVFEARAVGTVAPVTANILQKIVFWNGQPDTAFRLTRHPSWNGSTDDYTGVNMVDIGELAGTGNGCTKILDSMRVLCTIYHPYLESASMTLTGPSGTINLPLSRPPLPPGATRDDEVILDLTHTFAATDPACAYILKVKSVYRLSNGTVSGGSAFHDFDEIAFCKS